MATYRNKYSFCCIHRLSPFSIKTNLRENRFFADGERLMNCEGTHNVKVCAEKITILAFASLQVAWLNTIDADEAERMGKALFFYFYPKSVVRTCTRFVYCRAYRLSYS